MYFSLFKVAARKTHEWPLISMVISHSSIERWGHFLYMRLWPILKSVKNSYHPHLCFNFYCNVCMALDSTFPRLSTLPTWLLQWVVLKRSRKSVNQMLNKVNMNCSSIFYFQKFIQNKLLLLYVVNVFLIRLPICKAILHCSNLPAPTFRHLPRQRMDTVCALLAFYSPQTSQAKQRITPSPIILLTKSISSRVCNSALRRPSQTTFPLTSTWTRKRRQRISI